MPKISVIMPTYNGSKYIKRAIESVLNQSETDFEFIIVNDCSSDNTLEIITEYALKDNRIKVISNDKNLKLPATLNVGFKQASGKYLTWTSDDNEFKQDALKFMSEFLDSNDSVDLITCAMDYIDEDGNFLSDTEHSKKRKGTYCLAGYSNIDACFMYRKSIADKIGEYDTDLFCAEDYDYWCRVALAGNIQYSHKNYYKYRLQPNSLSATKENVVKEKICEIQAKYSDQILEKYKATNKQKADMYYCMYKYNLQLKTIIKAFYVNPLVTFVRFLLYNIRNVRKILAKS